MKDNKKKKGPASTNKPNKAAANKNMWWLAISALIVVAGVILFIVAPWRTEPADDGSGDGSQIAQPQATPTPEPTQAPTQAPEPTPEPTATPTPIPDEMIEGEYNPLTGVPWDEDLSRNRPWAVAIGNTNFGVNLRGVASADIICEYLNYSSGETRIMAIYQDVSNVEYIRGLRSLRSSSMELAASFDAIFAHWGGRLYSGTAVSGSPITSVGTFDAAWVGGRMDEDILPGGSNLENRAYVTGSGLVGGLPDSFRAQHEDSFSQGFVFTADGTPEGGVDAEAVTVSFATWSSKTTTFEYNADDGLYYASQYGRKFTDLNNNEQISFANVIVMKMGIRRNYNRNGHVYIDTTTDGREAYYISGGRCIEILYKRGSLDDPYTYYLLDGTPLKMGIGKTYICSVENTDDFNPISFD